MRRIGISVAQGNLFLIVTCLLRQSSLAAPTLPEENIDSGDLKQTPFVQGHASEVVILPRPDLASLLVNNTRQDSCSYSKPDIVAWEEASTWPSGVVPTANGAKVVLPADTKVVVGAHSFESGVYGVIQIPSTSSLIFKDEDVVLKASGIIVEGKLVIGETSCPLKSNITLTLHGSRSPELDPFHKGIHVTGTLDVHGQVYGPTWTRLATHAAPGDQWLFLQDLVTWQHGQQIVVTTTSLKDSLDFTQNEVLEVELVRSVNQIGPQVSAVKLKRPLIHSHYAGIEYQAEVALLSRNIVIEGDASSPEETSTTVACSSEEHKSSTFPCYAPSGYGGHIMVEGQGIGRVQGVQLYRMGQTNRLGRYPFHLHLLGDRGQFSYIRDSSIERSFFRCVSIHGTNSSLVSGNVAFDVVGHCYFLEDGVEELNRFEYNFGAYIHFLGPVNPPDFFDAHEIQWQSADETSLILPSDTSASVFYAPNAMNEFIGNAASGGWTGFAFPVYERPIKDHADLDFIPGSRPLLKFDGNTAHSTGFWYAFAGGVYTGGLLVIENGILKYNGGRNGEGNDPCDVWVPVGQQCPYGNRRWNVYTNTKVFLANRGLQHWGNRAELQKFEAHDCARGANMFGYVGIKEMLVTCRTDNQPAYLNGCPAAPQHTSCATRDTAYWETFDGFQWYDTEQSHIITNSTFRNCTDQWPPCLFCDDAAPWSIITQSDEFVPEIMQATRNIQYDNVNQNKLWSFTSTEHDSVSGRLANWWDVDGSTSLRPKPQVMGSTWANKWWQTRDDECTVSGTGRMSMYLCDKTDEVTLASIILEADPALTRSIGVSQCSNGMGLPCNAVGYANHLLRGHSVSSGLVLTANTRISGFIDQRLGGGWYVRFSSGAPTTLTIKTIQLEHESSALILALPYPSGTSFTVSAHAHPSCVTEFPVSQCQVDFQESSDPAQLASGRYFYFDKEHSVLLLNVVTMPYDSLGKDGWDRAKSVNKFSYDGLSLISALLDTTYRIEVSASCLPTDGTVFCPLQDDLNNVRTQSMSSVIATMQEANKKWAQDYASNLGHTTNTDNNLQGPDPNAPNSQTSDSQGATSSALSCRQFDISIVFVLVIGVLTCGSATVA